MIQSEMWNRFGVNAIRIWDIKPELEQFALRSFLVTQNKPLLNSEFLVSDLNK
jgi:hypothetical protein